MYRNKDRLGKRSSRSSLLTRATSFYLQIWKGGVSLLYACMIVLAFMVPVKLPAQMIKAKSENYSEDKDAVIGYVSLLAMTFLLTTGIALFYIRRMRNASHKVKQSLEERTWKILRQKQMLDEKASLLEAQNKMYRELDDYRKRMGFMIVNDLKIPIKSIKTIASSGKQDPSRQSILKSANRMQNLVMNVLDLHLYEESKLQTRQEDYSLIGVIHKAVEQVRLLLNEKSLYLEISIPVSLGVRADEELLQRVMVNLLANSIKSSPLYGTITISSACVDEEHYRISISDNGPEIPQHELDKMFDRSDSFSIDNGELFQGNGLGLTFCKMAIEAHGGQIGAESAADSGTNFWFTLHKNWEPISSHTEQSWFPGATNDLELTPCQMNALFPVVTELREIPIYRLTEIKNALRAVKDDLGTEVAVWRSAVMETVRQGDNPRLQMLLDQVTGQRASHEN